MSFEISQRNFRESLALTFQNGVCSKLVIIEKETSAFKASRRKEKKEETFWVRKVYKDRLEKGEFQMLIRDLRLHDHEYFFACFRMSPSTFEELLSFVAPIIGKKGTVMQDPIRPSERLAVTLRYLVTEDARGTL